MYHAVKTTINLGGMAPGLYEVLVANESGNTFVQKVVLQ